MGSLFAGLGISLALLAASIKIMKQAKRTSDKAKQGKLYRLAAIINLIAGAAAVGSNFFGVASGIAAHLPGALVGFAAVFCALGVFFDCIGKENYAGKGTVIIALFVPFLLVVAPLSVFGLDPGQLVNEVKSVTSEAGIVQTSGR